MLRRVITVLLLGMVMLTAIACSNKNVKNPLAQVDSKQPDKVLFDRAMEAMKKNKYDVARLSLQTLINTYPESEYIARAKLAIGDAWYAEGGSAALAQAENEYKDFITFFPNMPEAAEAQLRVADIHYRQMEKPDRDFTHAKRAEDEYRQLLLQFPDSKLAETARAKLLEVQEVLAEREFRIGRFYYLRQSWSAANARLKSLSDTYPLYSAADEVLFMLGDGWERQIEIVRTAALDDSRKNRFIREFTDQAAAAYAKILTRYPVMPRAVDAKERLAALDRPIPTATEEAIAQNTAEQESRGELGKMGRIMLNFRKRPDTTAAVKVGQPTLVDPQPTSAAELNRRANALFVGTSSGSGKVSVETVKDGTAVPESEAVPRSDSDTPPAPEGIGELKPNPDAASDTGSENPSPAQAPPQVNEAAGETAPAATATDQPPTKADPKSTSSSKKKQKKGLRKIIPF